MANETQHGIISFTSYVHITKNKALSGDEKNLLNLLFALSIQLGYSYATNDYLADIIGKSESAIAIMLTRLKSKGLIVITDNSKRNRDRKITIPSLEKFAKHTKKTLDALTPEVEPKPLHVSVEEPTPNYDKFVPQKKAYKTTNIINIGQVVLSPRMREYASKKGFDDAQTERIFEHFLSHHTSKGSTFKDWDAAFNTWLINISKFDKKNFSDAPARNSSTSSSVGVRIALENQIISEHPAIERIMMRNNIYIAQVMLGTKMIPNELSHYALMELRTPKEGLQTYWYDTRKYTKQHDDIVTVDVIEYKG